VSLWLIPYTFKKVLVHQYSISLNAGQQEQMMQNMVCAGTRAHAHAVDSWPKGQW
jgi:hypothetical protein